MIMAKNNLSDVALKMRKLDICMLTTQKNNGELSSRPMSNNGDVEYDGNSYFFTFEESHAVKDITENPQVSLNFEGDKDLYIALSGKAKLITDKEKLKEHWLDELKQWFPQGTDTPGITMIHVKANRIKYWQNEDEGEVKI